MLELSVRWYLSGGGLSSSEGGLRAVRCRTCPPPTRILFTHPAGAWLFSYTHAALIFFIMLGLLPDVHIIQYCAGCIPNTPHSGNTNALYYFKLQPWMGFYQSQLYSDRGNIINVTIENTCTDQWNALKHKQTFFYLILVYFGSKYLCYETSKLKAVININTGFCYVNVSQILGDGMYFSCLMLHLFSLLGSTCLMMTVTSVRRMELRFSSMWWRPRLTTTQTLGCGQSVARSTSQSSLSMSYSFLQDC